MGLLGIARGLTRDQHVIDTCADGVLTTRSGPTCARPLMEQYLCALRLLASRLTEAFALSLGLPQHHFKENITAPCVNLRVNHYPKPPKGTPGLGCGAHTDYGLFTILLQDMVGGLQVPNPNPNLNPNPNPNHEDMVGGLQVRNCLCELGLGLG